MARARRRSRRLAGEVGAGVGVALVAIILVLGNYVAARHYRRADWTRAKVYTLSDRTIRTVRSLKDPLRITVVEVPEASPLAADVQGAVRELCQRLQALNPRITVEYLDPVREPERAQLLITKYRITNLDVQTGIVVFDNGRQSKYVTQEELAEYDFAGGPGGRRTMKAFKGEQAFLGAILTISEPPKTLCFVKGHREADSESFERTGFSILADELRRESYKTRVVEDLGKAGVPAPCDAVIVGGPQRAWPREDVLALDTYLQKGGRALLLLGPLLDQGQRSFLSVGLEDLLERYGVHLGQNIVLDPEAGLPSAWVWKTDHYADHPITSRMTHAPTVWPLAREVRALTRPGLSTTAIVTSGDGAWGETNLASLTSDVEPRFDAATDVKGPVPVAVAVDDAAHGGRLVVLGSPNIAINAHLDVPVDYDRDLVLNAVGWVVGRSQNIGGVGPKATEHIRLAITGPQLRTIFVITAILMPLGVALLGAAVWWLRRS